jgi:hypothetical protein
MDSIAFIKTVFCVGVWFLAVTALASREYFLLLPDSPVNIPLTSTDNIMANDLGGYSGIDVFAGRSSNSLDSPR